MHSLIIVAMGLFINGTSGQGTIAVGQVDSVIECASVINVNRHPIPDPDGSYWYLVDATCAASEQGE